MNRQKSRPLDPGASYRFDTFRTGLLLDDMRYRSTDLGPGDRVPDFDLPTLDGGRFARDTLGARPVLLVFGSRTCPVTEGSGPVLRRLHAAFGDAVRFVFVNTREAHPGEHIPQPRTAQEKWAHAERLRDHHGLRFEVAVDDIDGTLHRRFSPKPNSGYLIDPDGAIVYRAHWANDEQGLRDALEAVASGRAPDRGRSRRTVRPLMQAVGHLPGIVRDGGPKVERDVWRAAPPLAILGRLTTLTLLRRLPHERRGPVAALVLALVLAAIVLVAAAAAILLWA